MKTLDSLKVGETTKVVSVHGEHTALRRRLLDMGLTPDTEVSITRMAPLGDPIELSLRGYSLTIRKSDASLVEVL
ncbi:Ferrous iron transport protein A [Anaerobiospirillum thomasii]|uniref:Ferrous iron transport protein A n=1 Tax=Anaerobiospirillum thomasii TaxID=179995 RepID=A0A2X0V3E0_9GAMM|nr:FeoA family protein [Anaerobiospirillum thomasii]SPT68443.1 Ferrous iron transport protein A [Anaerobiospirillum thomasii]SPT70949.1 Ferrous iron transport protein A [Anaerobiospirillum thomasii]